MLKCQLKWINNSFTPDSWKSGVYSVLATLSAYFYYCPCVYCSVWPANNGCWNPVTSMWSLQHWIKYCLVSVQNSDQLGVFPTVPMSGDGLAAGRSYTRPLCLVLPVILLGLPHPGLDHVSASPLHTQLRTFLQPDGNNTSTWSSIPWKQSLSHIHVHVWGILSQIIKLIKLNNPRLSQIV